MNDDEKACTVCGKTFKRNPRFSIESFKRKLTCSPPCTKNLTGNINVPRERNVDSDDGDDYRTIAEEMTNVGYKMNHSSVRNYVVRIVKKVVNACNERYSLNLDDETMNTIASSSQFHRTLSNVLHSLHEKRHER